MVQMRVTPGPQNQAQRTRSVSPIELVVNGLHCAASHTHTTSLRCHPHVPTFEPCPKWLAPAGKMTCASTPNDLRSWQNDLRLILDVTDVLGKMTCALT